MTTITLVEDDDLIRENLSELLSDEGFEVESFADSQSALRQFEQTLPNLALLDISLGNDTDAGFYICSELRKRSATLPIIFLTSHDSDFDKIIWDEVGCSCKKAGGICDNCYKNKREIQRQ